MNLVDLIKGQLGGDVISKVAGLLGTSTDEARTATNAGIPALLAGLTSVASSPEGARRLDSAVTAADDSIVGNIGSALAGPQAKSFLDQGSSALSSLLGGSTLSSLGSVLSRFTGLGGGSIMSLLGFLGPTVLGLLKTQKQRAGLDAAGLGRFLVGQKENITSAMPSGLSGMLGSIPGLSAFTGAADTARSAAYSGAAAARDTYARGSQAVRSEVPNARRWLVPVAALLALAGFVWWFANSSRPGPQKTVAATAVTDQFNRLSTDTTDFIRSTTSALGDIKDSATANAALPRLEDLNSRFESIRRAADALPSEYRSRIVSTVKASSGEISSMLNKILDIPGASDQVKQAVNGLISKINAFTT
jgi:hypothetical protein